MASKTGLLTFGNISTAMAKVRPGVSTEKKSDCFNPSRGQGQRSGVEQV